MTTRQSKLKSNAARRKKTATNSCGKCGCHLKNKPKSKLQSIKDFILKLLHLG